MFVIGIGHSILGERYILIRLLRRPDLPQIFGSAEFTKRTLRFAWHLTSVAWWGMAALFLLLARQSLSASNVMLVLGVTSLASALVTLVISRGRHPAWIVFLIVGGIALYTV